MKLRAALLSVFLLAGCATPAGQGSRLLPWNWFHADANARLDKAEARTTAAEDKAVRAAHVETYKAGLALAFVADSPAAALTRRTLGNGNGLLAQVAPLTAAEDAAARQIVADLLSGSAERAAAAERAQAAAESAATKLSRELSAAADNLAAATGKLAAANLENATAAAKYRRIWFWIYAIAGGWLALQLLSGIARFYPGLAPVARLAGLLSAPAVQAAYDRTTGAVGRALSDAGRVSASVADTMRSFLDTHTDAAEQTAIKTSFQKSQ